MATAAVLCALLGQPSGAAAAESLEQIRARGTLRVCLKKEGPASPSRHNDPAHFQKRDFELELAKLIAERILGDAAKLEIHTYRRPERLPAVADGTVDMGLSMFAINEENARLADFSIPYYESGLAIMHLPTTVIKDIADLDGKSIVAMNERSHDPGAALRDIAAAAGVKPRFRAVDRFEEGSRAVASGDADGMVGPHANLDAWIAAGHPEFVRSPLLTHERFAVAVAKGNAELLEQIDAVIADLESSGRLDALLRDAGLSLPESPSR
ncbi:MAG TPA: transporter substrate-binding domain-containing protein [Gammaproteobacteria bacterium]